MKRIMELKDELEGKLAKIVGPGAKWYHYAATEKGGKKVMGPHISVMVPVKSYSRTQPEALRRLYLRLYGPVRRVLTRRVVTMYSSAGEKYREIVLVLETKKAAKAERLRKAWSSVDVTVN